MAYNNVLSYTTTSPFPCDEGVMRDEKLAPGAPCMRKKTIARLKHLLDGKDHPLNVREYELLPSDGSKEAEIERKLMAQLECESELCLLYNDRVKLLLGPSIVKEEEKRFKTPGSRLYVIGTYSFHQKDILDRWKRIFPFFEPIDERSFIKKEMERGSKTLDDVSLFEMRRKHPHMRAAACPVGISVHEETDTGYHSVGIFADFRDEKRWTIEYFDSNSAPVPLAVMKWMERERRDLMLRYPSKRIDCVASNSGLIHQTEPNSCGLYVLIFIRRRLEGIPVEMFSSMKIPDRYAIDFRRHVYSA